MATIYFDMDGTIANLYSNPNWLAELRAEKVTPYLNAEPMLNFRFFARKLNMLQKAGYRLGIVSWSSKVSTADYDKRIESAKRLWLKKHLPSVHWDEIHVIPYGTPKHTVVDDYDYGFLFDDEIGNRTAWGDNSADEKHIMEILKTF